MASQRLVPRPNFEDYKEQFREYFTMERKNGIIQLRMHTNDGPVVFNLRTHEALSLIWNIVGNDPENEVMILTATGPLWLAEFEPGFHEETSKPSYQGLYECVKMVEDIITGIDFPTIGAINGPGTHLDLGLLCDITLCTEDVEFFDLHFGMGVVPGDGQFLVLQEMIGNKRAAYHALIGDKIDARTALEWGLVNEIVPRDKLMDRAWELAEMIMKQPRGIRRMTAQIIRSPWKRRFLNDLRMQVSYEMYGMALHTPGIWFEDSHV